MKVILQKNVQKLGKIGDVVESKPGYFRNYLQPRGFAVVATDGAMKKREEELEALKAKAEKHHQEAVALGAKITAVPYIKISQKAGDGGKLYGKVTNKDIAEALTKALGVDIDKKGVKTLEEITQVGTYKAYVKVAPDVQAEVNLVVYDETQGEAVIKIAQKDKEPEATTAPEQTEEAEEATA